MDHFFSSGAPVSSFEGLVIRDLFVSRFAICSLCFGFTCHFLREACLHTPTRGRPASPPPVLFCQGSGPCPRPLRRERAVASPPLHPQAYHGHRLAAAWRTLGPGVNQWANEAEDHVWLAAPRPQHAGVPSGRGLYQRDLHQSFHLAKLSFMSWVSVPVRRRHTGCKLATGTVPTVRGTGTSTRLSWLTDLETRN